jgi:hypothetical protein
MGKFMQSNINDFLQDRMHDKAHLIRRFQEHIEEVQKSIPPSRLLVFDVKQGWEPLCAFLEKPVPDTDFPNINDNAATKEIINRVIAEGFEAVFGYKGV